MYRGLVRPVVLLFAIAVTRVARLAAVDPERRMWLVFSALVPVAFFVFMVVAVVFTLRGCVSEAGERLVEIMAASGGAGPH
jgi:hypothetical protein